jgi:hypothetical protein
MHRRDDEQPKNATMRPHEGINQDVDTAKTHCDYALNATKQQSLTLIFNTVLRGAKAPTCRFLLPDMALVYS